MLGGGPEIPGGRVELGALSEKQRTSLRANSFGFIFQQGLLIPELTAEENVSLAAMISGVSREQARGASANLLARLGLGDMCEKRIGELSGGQAQRVAIARSQITGAPITFADEPTGALDSVTAQEVMDLLLTLVPQQGKTLLIVTHDPQIAAQCSRTIHLHDGQIVQDNRQDPTAPGQQSGEFGTVSGARTAEPAGTPSGCGTRSFRTAGCLPAWEPRGKPAPNIQPGFRTDPAAHERALLPRACSGHGAHRGLTQPCTSAV